MWWRNIQIILILSVAIGGQSMAQTSVLNTGNWYKIGITKNGVHQLSYQYLQQQGIPVSSLNPTQLQLFGNEGGMLPQENNSPRPFDLIENSIMVIGEEDGVFDPSDYVLFYADSPDDIDLEDGIIKYQDNIYSDTLFYFLRHGVEDGKRIGDSGLTPGNESVNLQAYQYQVHEINEFNLLNSGRDWYGETFDAPGKSVSIEFQVPEGSNNAKLTVGAMASSLADASFEVSINESNVGTLEIPKRPGEASYSRAFSEEATFEYSEEDTQLNLEFTFNSADNGAFGFLDFLVLSYSSLIEYQEKQSKFFRETESSALLEIQDFSSDIQVWDVSEVTEVVSVPISNDGRFRLDAQSDEFILFKDDFIQPVSIEKIKNQDIKSYLNSDFLIVTHFDFLDEANRLASHRASGSGLEIKVVTVDQIYNEFSSGRQDITAIRDYIKFLYDNGNLSHVLLFGDASYDYKDQLDDNTNFVPTYESRNSLNEIFTYSSDDFYGFMEPEEGYWPENSSNYTMDLAVGRLPVRNQEQAQIIVDKIIAYETDSKPGNWKSRMLYLADDGDANLHHEDADFLAQNMDRENAHVKVDKLYLDQFEQVNQYSADAVALLDQKIHDGVLIVDYTGHGNELQLATERLVWDLDIHNWQNLKTLPFFVTATCEFAVFDNPDWYSSGERLLFEPNGGGIGIISATRIVYTNSNLLFNQAFTQQVFQKVDNQYQSIGEVFRKVKNASLFGRNNRNYTLLADPTMRLNIPETKVSIDSIQLDGETVVSFKSFNQYTVYGSIQYGDIVDDQYDGEVTIHWFGSGVTQETLGDENDPFVYKQRMSLLHQVKLTVKSGNFEGKVLLGGIDDDITDSKIIAYSVGSHGEAIGGLNELEVMEIEPSANDKTPPVISLYMGDTLFVNEGKVGSNTELIVKLSDESGINLAHNSMAQLPIAQLNGKAIILNEYYTSDPDSYQSGKINYRFRGLEEGKYTLSFSVADIYGNSSKKEIVFNVVGLDEFVLNNVSLYPNPSSSDINFSFTHDRQDEDIQLLIDVYSVAGNPVFSGSEIIEGAGPAIQTILWAKSEMINRNIKPGVYIAQIRIKSLDSTGSAQIVNRIIIK